jgi:hypothetical protein
MRIGDLDHVGTVVGQEAAGGRRGQDLGQIDRTYAFEWML